MSSSREKEDIGNHMDVDVGDNRHESVEEAVFKYVGVGLRSDDDDSNKTNNNEMDWFFQDADDVSSTNNDESRSDNNHSVVAIAAVAAAAAYENDKNDNSDNHGNNNLHGNNNNVSYRKRKLQDLLPRTSDHNNEKNKKSKKIQSSNEKTKLSLVDPELANLDNHNADINETNEDDEDDVDTSSNNDNSKPLTHINNQDVSETDRLVRKAIIDSVSIAQQNDFQQFLNTEEVLTRQNSNNIHDDEDNNNNNDNENSNNDKLNLNDDKEHDDTDSLVRNTLVIGDLPHLSKKYPQLDLSKKFSQDETLDNQSSSSGHYKDIVPKVSLASDFAELPNVSKLIQTAAVKASSVFGNTTQSNGKAFDSQEEAALEQFVNDYEKIKAISRRQVCERIWSNERRKDDFWINICKVLPHRTRSSIYKHVRRKYHIFDQRGKWTPEEEKELARLCLEKEGQWSEVGKALGRMPEDCRDRWRNYLKCGGNRASHKWSTEEEQQLKDVINGILIEARRAEDELQLELENEAKNDNNVIQDLRRKRTRRSFKDIINWTIVSEKMHGTRSRIQCRYKWNKLIKKEALAKVETLSISDKRWILEKLRDLGFTDDSQVDWEELATLKPGIKLSGSELKLCFERMRGNIKSFRQRSINDVCRELLGLLETTGALDIKNM